MRGRGASRRPGKVVEFLPSLSSQFDGGAYTRRIGWLRQRTFERSIVAVESLITNGRARLLIECQDHPIIAHYADPIGKSLDNPKEAKKVLIRHLSHVEWQVRRLYRIRCCIVHGSKVAHTLAPFAANMEYYLKRVIILVLKCIVHYEQIRSRAQIFQRASLAFDRKVTELENAKDNKVIKQVIFEDIVLANSKSTLGF